jgi:alanyl-tRNA synthetase
VPIGERVAGEIDWPRRFDHMQQHTGQHILSAAFERLQGVRTESFRLGADVSTIDLAREVTPDQIAAAEEDSNRVVWEGRPVSVRFVTPEEAARLPLRKEPVRSGPLRLIEIESYDLSACGGTHVSRTGEVGLIAVCRWERFRGGTRVEFACGGRALSAFRAWREAVDGAARLLSALPTQLPAAVERLQHEAKDARRALKALSERAAELEAGALAARAVGVAGVALVAECLDGYDAGGLKQLASAYARAPNHVIVLATSTRPVGVVAARSRDIAEVDCQALVAELIRRFGGRGGGRPELAQAGGLDDAPSEVLADARTWLAAALARFTA